MAVQDGISFDDEEQLGQPGGPGAQAQAGSGAGANITGSAAPGGTAPQAAGAGAGGTGGWTNIQSYLDANKGNTGSAQALSQTVGDQFKSEQDKFTQDSSQFLSGAQAQVDKNKIDNGTANEWISQAANMYQWQPESAPKDTTPKGGVESGGGSYYEKPTEDGGGASPLPVDSNVVDTSAGYNDIVNKFKGALTSQYQGPKDYSYGFNAKTQEYGEGLKDNSGFDGIMNHLYSDKAQGPLTAGQYNLQKQLDVNNDALSSTREQLKGQYDELGKKRDETVQSTTQALGGLEQQYRTNQNSLKDYLGGRANQYQTDIDRLEGEARAGHKQSYEGGASGRANAFAPVLPGGGGTENMQNRGVWGADGSNLTWQQLQREQDLGAKGNTDYWYRLMNRDGSDLAWQEQATINRFKDNAGSLNDFYSAEDQKYANTADNEERAWNAIQDFLSSGATKKQQGFKVRG